MHLFKILLPVVMTALFCAGAERAVPATFYVDSHAGADTASGSSPETAWRSLERVNGETLIPGDKVLFKRGGLWRGNLAPKSGSPEAPLVYGAYGTGAKPILQGSVARDRSDQWQEVKPGIWTTAPWNPKVLNQVQDLSDSEWTSSFQEEARGTLQRVQEQGFSFNRVTCENPGKTRNLIQLWGPMVKDTSSSLMLRLRVRSTQPFKLETAEVMLNRPLWTLAMQGSASKVVIGPAWQTIEILLLPQARVEPAYLHINLGAMIPAGAVFDFSPLGLWNTNQEKLDPVAADVGILILNHGEKWGVKQWTPEAVQAPLDYWYDPELKRVLVASKTNPALAFSSVELALTRHIVNQSSCHDVIYDGLMLRYGAAHGFGGGKTRRITIRNCDLCWIGGGLQHWRKNPPGKDIPVRYGNAIEFWGGAEDHLVESNRIWEIYDAALTNQGSDDDSHQINIIYRHNVIWNSEYSFEFWNRPKVARTENILFEHNTCVDAGYCWSHTQRPDPNGAHLMFYHNPSTTKNVVIRNNIFVNSTEVCLRMENDWRPGLSMHNNLYWQSGKEVVRWLIKEHFSTGEFPRYQTETGLDRGSIFAAPLFVDPAARDYRLQPGSPGTGLATDGGPVGARLLENIQPLQ